MKLFSIINKYNPSVLSNKKRNLRKYSVVFLKHFPKKKVFGGPYILLETQKKMIKIAINIPE